MHCRALALLVLLVSPAWAQEPLGFDLGSEAVKKIVRDTAATQFAPLQVADPAPAKPEPAQVRYVPPEKPAKPPRQPPQKLPKPAPPSNSFLSAVVDILLEDLTGIEDSDDIEFSNGILRCRAQKEIKISPPGTDRCPTVY